jgi:putative glutamine amidotransferase
MATRRPLVAVTSRRLPIGRISSWLEPAVVLPTYYVDSLHRAGAVGAVLASQSPTELDVAALLDRFDGLVVTGGVDVDPARYGQQPHQETYGWEPDTDEWELALLQAAIDADMPVLGICRGAQILNVLRGGTLDQHVPDQVGEGVHGIPNGGGGKPNTIQLTPGSRVAAAFDAVEVVGNCHHHQAIGSVGKGLVVTGRTADGVVEAVEDPDASWLVAVQWHPEDSSADDPVQQRLFDHFVQVVAAFR